MIGLDTNLLVRLFVVDDPDQAATAKQLVDGLDEERREFINLIVLAELAWVLDRTYRFKREKIVGVISDLLESADLVIEREPLVIEALDLYRESKVEFADIVINLLNRDAGCETTATFDNGQRELATATVL